MNQIVHTTNPVLLVGGGNCNPAQLALALTQYSTVVAADGGAAQVLSAGHMPDAVYGDLDSLAPELQADLEPGVLRHIAEQDSTDFDKALRHIDSPLIVGLGFLGARLDHQLAAMTVLVRRADRRCVLLGEDDIVFLAPPQLSLDLPGGTRFSLFPLSQVTGRSEGLRWPIEGLVFGPDTQIGTSNETIGPVELTFDQPGMLVILPIEVADQVLLPLASVPGWSRARE